LARTVLLADDSVTAQNMGRRILMDAGYEVVTVNNGSAALKKIHESHPDLIVLDVYMPGYGGLEVCQRLKETAETARIPVLLSVGKMEPFKADEAKRVRADGHIVKPFEASELLAALARMEDRIVPQGDAGGKKSKSESRSRVRSSGDALAVATEEATDRVAYLTEKKRRADHEPASEETVAEVKAEAALAANSDQADAVPSAPPLPEVAAEVAAPFQVAAVETPAAKIPAVAAGDSQEWVLGKSMFGKSGFGKSVPAELDLSQSIFEKTVVGKSVSEAVPGTNAAAAVASASAQGPHWIAESVELSAEEAALDLDELMQRSRASRAVAIESGAAAQDPVTSEVAVAQIVRQAEVESEAGNPAGAAFAAAAAAGGGIDLSCQHSAFGVQPAQPSASVEASTAEVSIAGPEADATLPSEATLAWKNWQHIRDSVMSPKKAEAIAESVAAMAQAGNQATPPPTESAPNQDQTPSVIAAAAAAEEASSINEIVDSVLADLKPRLMQEIAKKLAAKK
jgi:CheY-like chemotaxis protein